MENISPQKIADFIIALDRYSIDDRVFKIVNEINHQINHLISYQRKRQSLSQRQELIEILDMNTVRELEDQLRNKRRDLVKKIINKKTYELKDWFEDEEAGLSLENFDNLINGLDHPKEEIKEINQKYFIGKMTPVIMKDFLAEISILCELKLSEKESMIF